MLICLGDLCRYREQALDSANFAKARDYYLRAQQLAPKNGKPYNQLALLAVYSVSSVSKTRSTLSTRRSFDDLNTDRTVLRSDGNWTPCIIT